MNVAAYALFGNRAFYWQFVPALVRAHHTLFPGWELRIYHDSTIYAPRSALLRAYAEAGLLTLVHHEENVAHCRSMLWRTLPVWEPNVDFVICRDLDSLPTIKDRRAVDQFIKSGAALHCVNDNPSHTTSVMGGMCGFNVKEFRRLTRHPSWDSFVSLEPRLGLTSGGWDQVLLHYHAYEAVFPSICEHRFSGFARQPDVVRASYDKVEPFDIPEIPQVVQAHSDELSPFLGAPGYDAQRAVDFYNEFGPQPLIERIKFVEAQVVARSVLEPKIDSPKGWLKVEPTPYHQKFALIAADENDTYNFFLPLTALLWKRIGYHPYVILVSKSRYGSSPELNYIRNKLFEVDSHLAWLDPIDGFKTHALAQLSRLYGGLLDLDDQQVVISSDSDMWPISEKFFEVGERFKLWHFAGCDGFFICYNAGTVAKWREVMKLKKHANLQQAITDQLVAGMGRGNDNWGYDEVLWNIRLSEWDDKKNCEIIDRPVDPVSSLPVGRIDRANWDLSIQRSNMGSGAIDAHMIRPAWHPEYWPRCRAIFGAILPEALPWADAYWQGYMRLKAGQS